MCFTTSVDVCVYLFNEFQYIKYLSNIFKALYVSFVMSILVK